MKNDDNISIPAEFSAFYEFAKKSGIKNEHLNAIFDATIKNMPPSIKSNPDAVKRYFHLFLKNMLPHKIPSSDDKQKQREIMIFVGPVGSGKTTTISKLAHKFARSNKKIGIITLDTYRIGAVNQLFKNAKNLDIPVIGAVEIGEIEAALKSLNNCDLILLDTVGNSRYDIKKLRKLSYILKRSGAKIDVNLVLSAWLKFENLIEIYDNFSFLNINTLIITRFDEAKILGNVFSLIYETNTPVSYFSTGQNIPNDIMIAKREFLVECILNAKDAKNRVKEEAKNIAKNEDKSAKKDGSKDGAKR